MLLPWTGGVVATASIAADYFRQRWQPYDYESENYLMLETQLLDNRSRAHLDRAAELIVNGQIVAFGFNGIFVFIGDADQHSAARRIAALKRQPLDKTMALICAPDYLDQFVDLQAPAFRYHPFATVQQLQREVFCLGVLLPAKSGTPAHMVHNGTILSIWMEYPDHHPGRYLQDRIRNRGRRAFIGSSTNLHGESTYTDPLHVLRSFGGEIPAVVSYDLCSAPPQRRRSSTLVDFTGEFPRLLRSGSVPVEELRAKMAELGLRDLAVDQPTQHASLDPHLI